MFFKSKQKQLEQKLEDYRLGLFCGGLHRGLHHVGAVGVCTGSF